MNLSSTTKNNTNALGQGQGQVIFGEHKTFRSFGSLNANTSNQRQVLYLGTSNTTNTITNNVSPFGVNPWFGTGLFNNQNNQNKPNNESEFFWWFSKEYINF